MKKVLLIILFCLFGSLMFGMRVDASTTNYIALGNDVDLHESTNNIYQNSSLVRLGSSKIKYGYESNNGNKFLRLANFGGKSGIDYTGFTIDLNQNYALNELSLSFNYRLYEGLEYYLESETIMTIALADETYELTTTDLIVSKDGDFNWNSKELVWSFENQKTFNNITICFYYSADGKYQDTKSFIDLDDLSFDLASFDTIDFSYAEVNENSQIDYSWIERTSDIQNKNQYVLRSGELDYECNTEYSNQVYYDFEANYYSQILARSGSSGTYRGATSVKAGESDGYIIYDYSANNTYLKLGNFNGDAGVTETRVVNYLYNPSTGELESYLGKIRIYYSFKYRLYMDDLVLSDLDYEQWALKFAAGSSNSAMSGWISFNELIINEPNDDTWHEYQGWIVTQVYSDMSYVSLQIDLHTEANINTKSYIDLDDLAFRADVDGDVVSHLGGSFEGLIDPDKVTANYQEDYVASGTKYSDGNINTALKLTTNQSLTSNLNWLNSTNVYHMTFDCLTSEGQLGINFGGKNGETVTITIGQNYETDNFKVYFSKIDNQIKASVYYIRTVNNPLYKVSISNIGNKEVAIDNLMFGQIENIAKSGDYATYKQELDTMKSYIEQNIANYLDVAYAKLNKANYLASLITEYSSQSRLDEVLAAYHKVLETTALKSDLSDLKRSINHAKEVMSLHDKSEYEAGSWLTFFYAYKDALTIDESYTQEEIDLANVQLLEAINQLELINNENGAQVISLVVLTSGGALTLGTALFLAIRRWRLW